MIINCDTEVSGHLTQGSVSPSRTSGPPANPYKFDIERQKAYVELICQGLGRCVAARAVGVSRSTVYNLMRDDSTFREAVHEAEQEVNDSVENALLNAALRGNVTACQVWLYNRRPKKWCDRRNAAAVQTLAPTLSDQDLHIEYQDDWYGTSTAEIEARAQSPERAAERAEFEIAHFEMRQQDP